MDDKPVDDKPVDDKAMDKAQAARAILRHLSDSIEQRGYFYEEGVDAVEFWDERDEAALLVLAATPHKTEPSLALVFCCSSDLDPKQAPVTEWIQGCIDAARTACPVEHEPFERVTWICRRERPGLTPL